MDIGSVLRACASQHAFRMRMARLAVPVAQSLFMLLCRCPLTLMFVAGRAGAAATVTVAQSLFMLLPITGMVVMRKGTPSPVHAPKVVIMLASCTAFSVLVTMFYLVKNWIGVGLCAANLGLRLIEATRYLQLVFRHRSAQNDQPAQYERLVVNH